MFSIFKRVYSYFKIRDRWKLELKDLRNRACKVSRVKLVIYGLNPGANKDNGDVRYR